MKVPDLDALIEEVEVSDLEAALDRETIFIHLLERFSAMESQVISISANNIYDQVKLICSFNKKMSHTKVFADICGYYYQLCYTATDVPAQGDKEAFTSFELKGIIESLEYILGRDATL